MLDFIWHLRGSVRLDICDSDATILDRVEGMLSKQRKRVIERSAEHLVFNDPLWRDLFGSNWLALVIYDRGRFWIEHGLKERELRYELRSLHGMILCLFAAIVAFLISVADGGLSQGLTLAGGAIRLALCHERLLALLRVPSTIRKSVVGN
jgi:hypothetical protein